LLSRYLIWREPCNLLRNDKRSTLLVKEGALCRAERPRQKAALTPKPKQQLLDQRVHADITAIYTAHISAWVSRGGWQTSDSDPCRLIAVIYTVVVPVPEISRSDRHGAAL
jgi:hypothetical protein